MTANNYINDFITGTFKVVNMFDTFIIDYGNLMKEWKMDMSKVAACETIFKDAKEDIDINISKLRGNVSKCVVFGRVSTGKSTLLNAIYSNDILPSYGVRTTNSFIEVHKSGDGTDYAIDSRSPTIRRNISYIRRADEAANDAIPRGSHIDLYYSTIPLKNDDVILVDTPGIDTYITMDAAIHRECEGADFLIMLVDSVGGISNNERDFLAQHRREFLKLKVFIVFNKWEMLHSEPEPRRATNRETHKNDAERCLRECTNVKEKDLARRVYFISALERLNIIRRDDGNVLPGRDTRDRDFNEFFHYLTTMMSECCAKRRRTLMGLVCKALDEAYNRIIPYRTESSEVCNRFMKNLILFNKLIETNIAEITNVFDAMYEIFFDKALELIKMFDNGDEVVTENRLQSLVNETAIETTESIKNIIRGMVNKSDLPEKDYVMKILETFYFPFYFDLTKEIKEWRMADGRETLENINSTIKVYTGITIAGITLGPGLLGAGIGVAVPIIDAIAIPVGLAIGLAGGGALGAVVAAIGEFKNDVSLFLSRLKRTAFSPRYSDHEDKIKKKWHLMRDTISKSSENFLLEVSSKVNDLMTPLDDKFNEILTESYRLRQMVSID